MRCRCRKVGEAGSQQLLLDTQAIKALLLDLPSTGVLLPAHEHLDPACPACCAAHCRPLPCSAREAGQSGVQSSGPGLEAGAGRRLGRADALSCLRSDVEIKNPHKRGRAQGGWRRRRARGWRRR